VKGCFYEIKGGNNIQKELILDIASWISPEFYFKCNEIIMNYFVSEYNNMDASEKSEKIKQLEHKMKDLEIEKDEIIQEKTQQERALHPCQERRS